MTRFKIWCSDGTTGEHYSPEFDDVKQDVLGQMLTPEYVMKWHALMTGHSFNKMEVVESKAEL